MIRHICAVAIACLVTGCISPRVIGAQPETPLWLAERIEEMERSQRGYPTLEDVPPYSATGRAQQEWEAGVAEMLARREAVLSDPALIDPDAAASDEGADDFARDARERTERDVARQTVED